MTGKQDRIHVIQMRFGLWLVAAVASFALVSVASAQLGDSSFDQFDHPAIEYLARPAQDPVAALIRRIEAGERGRPRSCTVFGTTEAGCGKPSTRRSLASWANPQTVTGWC